MRMLILLPLLLRLMPIAPAADPSPDDLRVRVWANTIEARGGERPNTFFGGGASSLILGQPQRSAFSRMPAICGFSVRPADERPALEVGAIGGWTVEVTPLSIIDRAVSLHVAWIRYGEDGKTQVDKGERDATLTVGESLPLDLVSQPARVRPSIPGCDIVATSLKVTVEHQTSPTWDRRLIDTDVWLIEHVSGGTERSQHTQVRGQFNVLSSFFFDDVPTPDGPIDLGGTFTARQVDGSVEVTIEPWTRFVDAARNTHMTTKAPTTITLKPDDVVSIELPPLKVPVTPRNFSISVRVRQVR